MALNARIAMIWMQAVTYGPRRVLGPVAERVAGSPIVRVVRRVRVARFVEGRLLLDEKPITLPPRAFPYHAFR